MKKKLLAITLCLTIGLVGCSTAWLSTVSAILAAAAPALINVLQIAAIAKGQPVDAALAAKVNGDAAALKTVLTDYATAAAAAQPGICPQVQSALTVYESDLPAVLTVAQVSDQNTQQKIMVISSLIVGVFGAIEPEIPGCSAPVAPAVKSMAASRNINTTTVSLHTFIGSYNSELVRPTGNPMLDKATPGMKLHQHGKFVRVITLGIAK